MEREEAKRILNDMQRASCRSIEEIYAVQTALDIMRKYENSCGDTFVSLPPYAVDTLLYEADPEYAVLEVRQVILQTGHEMGAKVNPIYPPTWSLQVEVIDGHGVGSHYCVYPEDIGKTVFRTPEEAQLAAGKGLEQHGDN